MYMEQQFVRDAARLFESLRRVTSVTTELVQRPSHPNHANYVVMSKLKCVFISLHLGALPAGPYTHVPRNSTLLIEGYFWESFATFSCVPFLSNQLNPRGFQ
jgi:hypothetical protein